MNFGLLDQKKFYTTTRIRVSQLAKIPTLFHDWWRLSNEEKVNYLTA